MSGVAYTLELTSVIHRSARFASQASLSSKSSSALQVKEMGLVQSILAAHWRRSNAQ